MVGVVSVMETSFKRTCAVSVVFSALALHQATVDPELCWRYLDTHVLWGIQACVLSSLAATTEARMLYSLCSTAREATAMRSPCTTTRKQPASLQLSSEDPGQPKIKERSFPLSMLFFQNILRFFDPLLTLFPTNTAYFSRSRGVSTSLMHIFYFLSFFFFFLLSNTCIHSLWSHNLFFFFQQVTILCNYSYNQVCFITYPVSPKYTY